MWFATEDMAKQLSHTRHGPETMQFMLTCTSRGMHSQGTQIQNFRGLYNSVAFEVRVGGHDTDGSAVHALKR